MSAPRARSLRSRLLASIVVVAFGAALAAWWTVGREVRVETARVTRGTLVRTVVTSGQVEAPRRTTLGPEVSGRVVSVSVDEGQHVDEGEVLLQLDDANARAAVEEARAAVAEAQVRLARLRNTGVRVALAAEARAQAEADQAQLRYARTDDLVSRGVLPSEQLDDARRARDTSAAQLRQAEAEAESASAGGVDVRLTVAALRRTQAALRSAERRLEQTALRAPAAGRVLQRNVEPGEVVQAGQALLEFVADGAPRLEVHPDESHLAFIRVGQSALASVEARPDLTFPASVLRIAPAVDATRGTVKVELAIAEPVPDFLLPGMTASVEIELARLPDVVICPAEAIEEPGGAAPSVWVVSDGRAVRRPVAVGLRAGELYEVTRGLERGDRVVLAATGVSLAALEEGARVDPSERPTPATSEVR
ncbi:MAG: efflux RND transporter periplasmic adaptor subunit [Polyangiales bacterium]|nr:efflux RND transporter periplasmic adaptor subunit [Sandaracinaceae bacterium]